MPAVRTTRRALRNSIGVLAEGRTYRNALYLLVAIPLGLVYYLLLTVGFVFGAILSLVLVGLPILFVTILVARLLADAERRLANALLDTDIPPFDDLPSLSEDGVVSTATALVRSDTTWRGVAFLVVKSFLGFGAWLFGLVAGLTALILLTAPLGGTGTIMGWTIDTLPERLLAVPLGVVLALAAVHAVNLVAAKTGAIAVSLLGSD